LLIQAVLCGAGGITLQKNTVWRVIMITPQHCPGFEQLQHLQSFVCKCSHCGKKIEIFSDEFDKKHVCKGCGKEVDFTQCTLES